MTEPQNGAEALEAVITGMRARENALRDRMHAELFDRVPSYRAVPRELLDEVWARHFVRVLGVLRDGRVPPSRDIDEAEVARDRVARGVSLSDGLRAFRRALGAMRDLFIAEATRQGLDPLVVVDRTRALWELADVESVQIALVHREAEISAALFDAQRRAAYLRGLLFGTLSAAEIHSGAAIYGLDPTRAYRAIRARPDTGRGTAQLARSLDTLCRSHGRTAMIAVMDEAVAGVVEAKPVVGDLPVTAGLGPPTALGQVHRSFRTAGRLLDAAAAYGLRGVHDLGDLSWRVAVPSEPELSELLLDRHLRPLAAEGEFGKLIEESVRAYFELGRHIGATAEYLHVHVNTLRYRLRRFEELTGARLDSPDTVVEISWALAARDVQSAAPPSPSLD
ncbi:helix-turn-helix domain-containing protein [Streptomyces sp. NA02950]|uniref:PucR family transcriptional regulator n=1 Tax=Streptomyces sp. NA02950 TaxID=2742137 RepID=UPI00159207F8|nr:helix-turn-helix domain-containing protein [Streptomyces sp. NA02950]QKV91685.1 helix-turn-helix domain-containing protein [Streptomyces sp. NA02950]